MDVQTLKKVDLTAYLEKFWQSDYRHDGRAFNERRAVSIDSGSLSSAEGSSLVRMGGTMMICGIKAEVAAPTAAHPSKGYLVVNVDYPPICAFKFKGPAPNELSQSHSHELSMAAEKVLNLEELCIESGQLVWTLYADILCISFDGNGFDCALSALIKALQSVKLPQVKLSETGIVEASKELFQKLSISPISSFSFCFHGKKLLIDPCADEEEALCNQIRIICNTQHLIEVKHCGLIDQGLLQEAIEMSLEMVRN